VTETRLVSEIIWREDLYPRFEPTPARIQQYAEDVELLPPIEINQHNELIDGYHRWTAHKKAKCETIEVIVTQTKSDAELDRLMVKRNADFGIQLSREEKKRKAGQWFQALTDDIEQIADDLSVTERTVKRWLSQRIKNMKEERDRKIAEMWLACHTQEEVAEAVGLTHKTISEHAKGLYLLDNWQKGTIFANYQDSKWNPPLYDVWKTKAKSNETSHPGNSEAQWLDNLLYMYTEPFDIVVDPFAGGGSTIDVCKKRLRRYWASDRLPIDERRDIRQWDILEGPPPLHKRWGDVALMYLDPPYWKQMEGKYSDDPQDLANMELDEFYKELTGFVLACATKMHPESYIALLIQPTQWRAPDRQVVDHVIDLITRLQTKTLKYIRRISCPYNTQQYNAQQIEWAKENRDVLVLTRELIVWKVEVK
jgi:DNA modification methylase